MARRVLVLHGPNLNLEVVLGRTLASLDDELVERGAALGLEVETAQASGEAALLDALHAKRAGLSAVIVSPSSLAPVAYALADALEALELPSIEVQLKHDAKSRGRSALKRVVDKQFHGHGVEGYFKALAALAKGDEAAAREADDEAPGEAPSTEAVAPPRPRGQGKTIGRVKPPPPGATPNERSGKSIGRRAPTPTRAPAQAPAKSVTPSGAITRALVREQLSARLGKKVAPEAFAQWARTQWLALQRGAAVEDGQKEKLEDLLLLLSTSAKSSDHVILSYAAKLES